MSSVVSAFNKMAKAKSKPNRQVESVEIQPAEGGWTCNVRYKPEEKKEAKGDMCCSSPWESPKPMVFTDKDKMLAHLGGLL